MCTSNALTDVAVGTGPASFADADVTTRRALAGSLHTWLGGTVVYLCKNHRQDCQFKTFSVMV